MSLSKESQYTLLQKYNMNITTQAYINLDYLPTPKEAVLSGCTIFLNLYYKP